MDEILLMTIFIGKLKFSAEFFDGFHILIY